MKIQIAIIGLGQIGASLGMAFGTKPDLIFRVGYDENAQVMRQALKLGAIDQTATDVKNIIEKTDAILMALPTDKMCAMMEELVPLMQPGAVLMDTALSKEMVAEWAKGLLPDGCSYVGLTPVINPNYLISAASGIEGARGDFFHNGMIAISSPPNTNSKAIKLATDLARILGATVLFADMREIDSMMTATHIVPQLMAAALLNATVDQPNWRDASQLAGRAYAEVSGPIEHLGLPGNLAVTAVQNRENVLRVLDSVIASLQTLRNDIDNSQAEALTKRLERARKGRDQWLKARSHNQSNELTSGQPTPKSSASRLFGNLLRSGNRQNEK